MKKGQMPGLVHLQHIQNKIRDIMQALFFFLPKGARRLGFISFSVLFYRVTKSFNTSFDNSY